MKKLFLFFILFLNFVTYSQIKKIDKSVDEMNQILGVTNLEYKFFFAFRTIVEKPQLKKYSINKKGNFIAQIIRENKKKSAFDIYEYYSFENNRDLQEIIRNYIFGDCIVSFFYHESNNNIGMNVSRKSCCCR